MSLDYADAKTNEIHVKGNDIQDVVSPSTAIFFIHF